jgi:DNA-binding response OmpR family regulator
VAERAPAPSCSSTADPGIDGLATCRALREARSARRTIVMLTRRGRGRGQRPQAGADHFLTKPFSPLDPARS